MTSASTEDKSSPVYKLKRIDFFGRKVPIALQNENGPCPLLAIANILLLKKQIELPEHAPDISQVHFQNFDCAAGSNTQNLHKHVELGWHIIPKNVHTSTVPEPLALDGLVLHRRTAWCPWLLDTCWMQMMSRRWARACQKSTKPIFEKMWLMRLASCQS